MAAQGKNCILQVGGTAGITQSGAVTQPMPSTLPSKSFPIYQLPADSSRSLTPVPSLQSSVFTWAWEQDSLTAILQNSWHKFNKEARE